MVPAANVAPDPGFSDLLDAHQARLFAYILSLTGNPADARDIRQDCNLVMWRKADQFRPGTNFTAWAFRVAHFQVLSWRQKRRRELLVFDDGLLDGMAEAASAVDAMAESRLKALHRCLQLLPERQREVIRRRYLDGEAVQGIAARTGMEANAVSQLLFRARKNLLECIRRHVADGSDDAATLPISDSP